MRNKFRVAVESLRRVVPDEGTATNTPLWRHYRAAATGSQIPAVIPITFYNGAIEVGTVTFSCLAAPHPRRVTWLAVAKVLEGMDKNMPGTRWTSLKVGDTHVTHSEVDTQLALDPLVRALPCAPGCVMLSAILLNASLQTMELSVMASLQNMRSLAAASKKDMAKAGDDLLKSNLSAGELQRNVQDMNSMFFNVTQKIGLTLQQSLLEARELLDDIFIAGICVSAHDIEWPSYMNRLALGFQYYLRAA